MSNKEKKLNDIKKRYKTEKINYKLKNNKISYKKANKKINKINKRTDLSKKSYFYKESFNYFNRAQANYTIKRLLAEALNMSANLYIQNSNSSYAVKRGVDFVRNVGVKGLEVSASTEYIKLIDSIINANKRSKKYKK